MTRGDIVGNRSKGYAQGSDQREEGGDVIGGGPGLALRLVEEEQWEDISNRGEDEANGSEAKEAHHTLRRKTSHPGRTILSPRRNRRGFWLGRKSKLLGEASKKQNTKQKGVEPRSMETLTPVGIGLNGLVEGGSNPELDQQGAGSDHRATSGATRTGSNSMIQNKSSLKQQIL